MNPPRSILIVEDERIVAADLEQTLAAMGYEVSGIASSADEALARAGERCPDLVLMDIRIKGEVDGIALASIVRERFGAPVVYLTALADGVTLDRARLSEPYAYLLKPVRADELRSAIEISLYRHEMDRCLRRRERWFATTLHSIADTVITVDREGRVIFMNRAAETLTGTTLAECAGRPAREVLPLVDASSGTSAEMPLEQALRERQPVAVRDLALLLSAGTFRTISESAAPVDDGDDVLGAVMVARDVTAERLLQKQLEQADRLASLGTMAAGVAHEVNNPLAAVVVNATHVREELLAVISELNGAMDSSEVSRRIREAIDAQAELQSSAARIGRIVADLRAFSRPAGSDEQSTEVARAVEWAVRTTAHELRERARVVTHLTHVPCVALDETRLGQVLVNLLLNAAHSIPPGDLERNEVAVDVAAAPENHVLIEIRDTGCGMSPEVLKRVFEPFFTTKPVGVGTGLGLSVCHGIVTSAGGRIEIESRVGQGTVFRVTLPSSTVGKATETEGSLPRPEQQGRLLIVDDELMVRRALARILKDHQVVSAESARAALTLFETEGPFDVILSDLVMPDMTGMEFYAELLRSRPEDARRVIFLTGGAVTPRVADFLATVPNARLEKPFEVDRLKTLVQQILSGQWRG